MKDYQLYLITGPNCNACGPYKGKLQSWGIEFQEIDGSTREGRLFCAKRGIQGVPSLVVIEGGRFIGAVPGAVQNFSMLKNKLKELGVYL